MIRLVTLAAILVLAGSAAAQIEDLYVRGFVSQGWLNSRDVNYLVDDSRDGTAEFHEAAVSIQARPEEKLRVGLQFLARDFGEVGNNNVVIDWAYADYHHCDYAGFRFGKFKTLQGLYGQGRDVDMLRPTILLPQSVYNEEHRDFIVGMEGAGVYGNIPLDDGGQIDYELYAGTLNVPDADNGFWDDIWVATGKLSEINPPPGETWEFLGVDDSTAKFDWVWGGGLQWQSPVDGIRLGATYFKAKFDMNAILQFRVTDDDGVRYLSDRVNFDGDLGRIMTLSGEYTRGPLTFTAEYTQERLNAITSEGWYGQTSWQAAEKLAITAYYSEFYGDRENRDGQGFVEQGQRDFFAWQRDHCLALRYDVTDHWLLKFEHHLVDGTGLSNLARNDLDDPIAMRRWWQYSAAKATFYF
jgi:hypothetical protein